MALSPVPFQQVLVDLKTRLMDFNWVKWLQSVVLAIDAAPAKVGTVTLTVQAASVSATAFMTTTLPTGLYRLSYYTRITRAATSSSSLTPVFAWTDGGVSCSSSRSAVTGNTTATTQGETFPIQVDAGTSVTYALTYASTGVTAMQYAFRARLEALP